MKALKKTIIEDLLGRINASPFLVVVDYQTATVAEFEALRGKLGEASAEIHVTKNAYMKRVAKDAELPEELNDALRGQTAIVTGESDICAAAKALKDFNKDTGKVAVRSGVLDGKILSVEEVGALASLPPMEILRAQLLGALQAPAGQLVRLLNEPASALARVLKAKEEQG